MSERESVHGILRIFIGLAILAIARWNDSDQTIAASALSLSLSLSPIAHCRSSPRKIAEARRTDMLDNRDRELPGAIAILQSTIGTCEEAVTIASTPTPDLDRISAG